MTIKKNSIKIRIETVSDLPQVEQVIIEAFKDDPIGDHTEHFLVNRLRKSDAFIPELSLVAELNGKVVGHILLTRMIIKNDNQSHSSLSLAPVSVHPAHQGKGIGCSLIRKAHEVAISLGHKSIILLGHKDYYPRFGYKQASAFGVKLPFDVPDKYCMALELVEDGLKGVSGMVEYPKEFYPE